MGKNKLKKFAELEELDCVIQYPRQRILEEGFPHAGKWHENVFGNSNPIVLELGCGKGEYTVALAASNPQKNYLGIDIKGARLWKGARDIKNQNLNNARLLRTEIESIGVFFGKGEIDEIWITFPDPQMQKCRKRLTSTRFLKEYAKILKPGGKIHLKTDSPFLFEYTKRLVETNGLEILELTDDLYGSGMADPVKSIKTYYETQWLSRGLSIKLISFVLNPGKELKEPVTEDIKKDDYRSKGRIDEN